MQAIWTWLSGLDGTAKVGIALIVAGLAYAVYDNWSAIKARFTSSKKIDDSAELTQDVQDLRAVEQLDKRAERLNCPEMRMAVKTIKDHFFHEVA